MDFFHPFNNGKSVPMPRVICQTCYPVEDFAYRENVAQKKRAQSFSKPSRHNPCEGNTVYACAKRIDGVWFGVACEEQSVIATSFGSNDRNVLQSLSGSLNGAKLQSVAPSVFAEKAFAALSRVYEGKGTSEDLPLNMERLPAYTQRVLRTVSRIPVGYVASYGGVAEAAGGGARAVGNAMASNPFAPLVPCHRVVTSNLGLGGYGGSLRIKFDFLQREKRGYTEPKSITVESGVLKVFPVESVLRNLERHNFG